MTPPGNIQLALARRADALSRMDADNAKLRGSGFDLTAGLAPYWDRSIWEAYKSQFGEYPFSASNKPPDVTEAPAWVKQLCGISMTPAERMGSR